VDDVTYFSRAPCEGTVFRWARVPPGKCRSGRKQSVRTGRWRNTNACDGIGGEPSIRCARLPCVIQRSLLTGRSCTAHRLDGKSWMSGDVQVRIWKRLGVRLPPRSTRSTRASALRSVLLRAVGSVIARPRVIADFRS